MTKSQQQAIAHLTRVYAHMERSAKLRRRAHRSAELAALGILIATFVTDALEQRACNRKLQQLQQEKNALTAQFRRGPTSTLGAATRFALIAALRTIERERRVYHLRRLAATAALVLHERAARGFLRAVNRTLRAELGAEPVRPEVHSAGNDSRPSGPCRVDPERLDYPSG